MGSPYPPDSMYQDLHETQNENECTEEPGPDSLLYRAQRQGCNSPPVGDYLSGLLMELLLGHCLENYIGCLPILS